MFLLASDLEFVFFLLDQLQKFPMRTGEAIPAALVTNKLNFFYFCAPDQTAIRDFCELFMESSVAILSILLQFLQRFQPLQMIHPILNYRFHSLTGIGSAGSVLNDRIWLFGLQ